MPGLEEPPTSSFHISPLIPFSPVSPSPPLSLDLVPPRRCALHAGMQELGAPPFFVAVLSIA